MNVNPRIKLDMNVQKMIVALADGNPGAITVCVDLVKKASDGFMDLLFLDNMAIYGADIWMLYKAVCACDIRKTHACIIAANTEQPNYSSQKLKYAIQNRGEGFDLKALCEDIGL